MGLYAMFIVSVGVPLLAATVDISRLWLKRAQLTTAVESACSAYANSANLQTLMDTGTIKLEEDARREGYRLFSYNMPSGGELTGMTYTTSVELGYPVITAVCTGRASIRPLVLVGAVSYDIEKSVTVKIKLGSSNTWR
jgi:hypothetical protein